MFIIELTYNATLAEIDAHMAAHVSFLKKYYAAGKFLVSGRKVPRDGGIIIAVGASRVDGDAAVQISHVDLSARVQCDRYRPAYPRVGASPDGGERIDIAAARRRIYSRCAVLEADGRVFVAKSVRWVLAPFGNTESHHERWLLWIEEIGSLDDQSCIARNHSNRHP